MNRDEFIGKLQLCYFGDRNAFNEIVEDNQKLKNIVVYSKVEIDRLNNIIDGLKKWLEEETRLSDEIPGTLEHSDYTDVLDKLKALKENNK